VMLPVNGYEWVAELRAWRRDERPTPLLDNENVRLFGALIIGLGGLFYGVAGILNLLGVLHWGWPR